MSLYDDIDLNEEPVAQLEAPSRKFDWEDPQFRARVLSAIVLAPIVLGAVFMGGLTFHLVILITAIFMMREWDAMNAYRDSTAWSWGGVAYVSLTCLSLIQLRSPELGGSLPLLLYLLVVVWATDIGAYFAGRSIGGPKLAPRISPKKTWAGLAGGIIAAMAVGGILGFFFPFPESFVQAAWLGALLAIISQMGDLFESWMKRQAGVKDSGNLIPGHGGILDRVDGFTFAAPALMVIYLIATHAPAHEPFVSTDTNVAPPPAIATPVVPQGAPK